MEGVILAYCPQCGERYKLEIIGAKPDHKCEEKEPIVETK